jgi:hypothetical protein
LLDYIIWIDYNPKQTPPKRDRRNSNLSIQNCIGRDLIPLITSNPNAI